LTGNLGTQWSAHSLGYVHAGADRAKPLYLPSTRFLTQPLFCRTSGVNRSPTEMDPIVDPELLASLSPHEIDKLWTGPAMEPPLGQKSSFAHPHGNHVIGYFVVILSAVLVTMSVVSRLASRWLMKSFDVEDGKSVPVLLDAELRTDMSRPHTSGLCMSRPTSISYNILTCSHRDCMLACCTLCMTWRFGPGIALINGMCGSATCHTSCL
jgi:hypothetical protein